MDGHTSSPTDEMNQSTNFPFDSQDLNDPMNRRPSHNSATEDWELTELLASESAVMVDGNEGDQQNEGGEEKVTPLESFAERTATESSERQGVTSPFLSDDEDEESLLKRASTSLYMEEASMETVLDNPQPPPTSEQHYSPQTTLKIHAAGRPSNMTDQDIVVVRDNNVEESIDFTVDNVRSAKYISERQASLESLASSSSSSLMQESFRGKFESFHDSESNNAKAESGKPVFSPQSSSRRRLRNVATSSLTVPEGEESSVLELLVEYQILPENTPPTDDYAILLHLLLQGFCAPSIDLGVVQQVVALEQTRDFDARSNISDQPTLIDPSRIIRLLSAGTAAHPALLRFPIMFVSSLLRILVRLLTFEPDDEYNESCFLTRPTFDTTKPLIRVIEEGPNDPDHASRRPHLLYTFARFQYYWNKFCRDEQFETSRNLIKDHRPSLQVLWNLWERAATSKHWVRPQQANLLLAPLARFMGLVGVAGVSPWFLRRLLTGCQSPHYTNTSRMCLLRAMRTAASGASRPLVMSRTPPRHFFSLSGGGGMHRTITGLSTWPFRNDFGMAVWFRAERLDPAKAKPILLSVRSDDGGGIEVSLVPLSHQPSSDACTVAVSIFDSSQPKPTRTIDVQGCVLLPRVWYHLVVRHTRSRLKGVFSMSTRQQVSIMLDGKVLLTDSLAFPNTSGVAGDDSASSLLQAGLAAGWQQTGLSKLRRGSHVRSRFNLCITFADSFEGQTGTLYLLNDHVSDASFSALYETTGGNNNLLKRSSSTGQTWDSRRSAIVKRSRVLDANITNDDAEEIVLSHRRLVGRNMSESPSVSILDIGEGDDDNELHLPSGLELSQFGSRVFLSWDPRRTFDGMVIELHVGSHLSLSDNDFAWSCNGSQDGISSVGGMQSLVPIFRVLLTGVGTMKPLYEASFDADEDELFSPLPDIFMLLTAFINEHHDNAREFLRCGGVDVLEQLILSNRRSFSGKLFQVIEKSEITAYRLVHSLFALRIASTHYVGLETKVFSRLVFNIPLWLGGATSPPIEQHLLQKGLLPVLSRIAKSVPGKVRDCVGARDMVLLVNDYLDENNGRLGAVKVAELSHALDILLGMIFNVLSTGVTPAYLSPFLALLASRLGPKLGCVKDGGEEMCTLHCDMGRLWNVKASAAFYLLLQIRPPVPGLVESFVDCCGSIQASVGWILATFIDTGDDAVCCFGLRSMAAFFEMTSSDSDLPLSLPNQSTQTEHDHVDAIIQTRGLGLIAKGIAAMGPGVRPTVTSSITTTTAKVAVTLMWHFLKSHRNQWGEQTRSALLCWINNDTGQKLSSLPLLQSSLISECDDQPSGYYFNMPRCDDFISETGSVIGGILSDPLALTVVMRLLRFLDGNSQELWISDILAMARASRRSMAMLSTLSDWQPILFVLIADGLETILSSLETESSDKNEISDSVSEFVKGSTHYKKQDVDSTSVFRRVDLCLDLYSCLLGFLFREGGDKALDAVERAASLQRLCVNGRHVSFLIFSNLCGNLFDYGTLRDISSMSAAEWKEIDIEYESPLLKQSARLVTDAILSNGTRGLDLNAAVRSWRSLRHLTEVVVAMTTACGYGVVDLFDYANERGAAIDSASKGIHGIRLPETRLCAIKSSQYLSTIETGNHDGRDANRRLSTVVAAQILAILDSFMFPDTLEQALPSSQLHGLSLVRNSDPRLGSSQGPLLLSGVRLSLILLSHIEPCSARFLQAIGRLRSLLQWILEFISELNVKDSTGIEIPATPVTQLDHLVLAVAMHCHRGLGRCSAVLSEIESSPYELYFENRDGQRKAHRRLLRAALELRDIVATAYRARTDLFMVCLSGSAAEALRSSLEGTSSSTSKESLVREFLRSLWVSGFQDVESRLGLLVPEQLCPTKMPLGSDIERLGKGVVSINALVNNSTAIVSDFEKVMDVWFKEYLENQKKWAATDAVRELELEGTSTLKRLAEKHNSDTDIAMSILLRRNGAENRWSAIQNKAAGPWNDEKHWKLAPYTDRIGRRTLLVPNRNFLDHAGASYEQDIDHERDAKPTILEKEFSDVMRRNAEAFTSHETAKKEELHENDLTSDTSDDEDDGASRGESNHSKRPAGSVNDLEQDEEWDKIESTEIGGVDGDGDSDAWAKVFIWTDNEEVVARFDPVMLVSLRSYVEGALLLTTHGLYFRQMGDEIGTITNEPVAIGEKDSTSRRWRLARLTEVHGRRYMLRPQALELFFSDSHELFLNFASGFKERDRFYAKLRSSCKTPMLWSLKSLNPRTVFRKSRLTELWRKRQISNFEYIMALNRMAGRSFNDITQYPVFPWVLADYTSTEIDLSDSRAYRDLTKPIGALNPDRLAQLIERYNDLELFGFAENEKFLYGSHYSSPGIVLHYLIRQEPFTTMAIELQSGRFDSPDRLFIDLADSWNSCLTSTADMKELIPEFYCLPEMFLNTNKFPLGRTQRGRQVDHVVLPPWAKGSPYEFVRLHRLALESDIVSQSLHHWLDLVFGEKQRGPEAMLAHNLFHHLSYEGSVDLDKISDMVDRKAAESHIQNFGQTPSQLIQCDPHPCRYPTEVCWKPLIHDLSVPKKLRCHTPSKQFGNTRSEHAKGAVFKIHVQTESILVVYGDMSIGTYRWALKGKKGQLRMDKLNPMSRREISTSRTSIKRGSAVSETKMEASYRTISSCSFAATIGGQAKELIRRKAVMPPTNRLLVGTDKLSNAETNGYVVSCGYFDDAVRIHSTETLRQIAHGCGGHQDSITCLAIGQDGGLMVTGAQDGTCCIWVIDHPDMSVAISDGYMQTVLGASNDGGQILSCCHVLWGHEAPMACVALDSDLDAVVSGCHGGLVCIHTIRRGEFIRSFHPPPLAEGKPSKGVEKVAMHGTSIVVVHMGDFGLHTFTVNGVRLCSTDAGEKLNDMIICSSGEILITGGTRCQVLIRTTSDMVVCAVLDLARHGPIRCIGLTPADLNPTPQFLFIGSDDGMITIVDEDVQQYVSSDSNRNHPPGGISFWTA
ncbi:hypothetical protein MPSEU_000444200 [Mayamaea pseudoterrestris]|nr:hypothetical protein MPSEU_000444200 [Mayamaea pseudoterrestris]